MNRMIAGAFEPDFLEAMLTRMAVLVQSTEVFAFTVPELPASVQPQLICHIRPDDASLEEKQTAVQAAIKLIQQPLLEMSDGIINLTAKVHPNGLQYCLITLLRDSQQPRRPICVIAMIVRCADDSEAERRLALLQGRPIPNSPKASPPPRPARIKPSEPRNFSRKRKVGALFLFVHGSLMFALIVLQLLLNPTFSPGTAVAIIVCTVDIVLAMLIAMSQQK